MKITITITINQDIAKALLGDLIDLYSADEAHLVLAQGRPESGIDDVSLLASLINDAAPHS